jgi:alcohol dehydrogenase class IV
MVPHGVSVVVNAPAVFRWTESACAERHREAARLLGDEDASRALERLMRDAQVPVGLDAIGYGEGDVDALVRGTIVQRRLLDNAPRDVGEAELASLFRAAMHGATS